MGDARPKRPGSPGFSKSVAGKVASGASMATSASSASSAASSASASSASPAKPGSRTVSAQASGGVSKTASRPASRPVSKPVSRPVSGKAQRQAQGQARDVASNATATVDVDVQQDVLQDARADSETCAQFEGATESPVSSEAHEIKHVKSNCHYCGYLCGFIATVEDGKLTALEPDPSRYPYDESVVKSCRRWRMNLENIDGPDRINYPLRRVGERGSGRWERVSWDEALDDIADRMKALVAAYGPGTVASSIGGPHATFWPLHRFMNVLGSPNNMGIGQICWNPRVWVDTLTFGWTLEADINPSTSGAVFLWATNPKVSDNSLFWRMLEEIAESSIPMVVVDPRKSETAKVADLHLAPFPGTDCTLVLGMIRQIIEEDLIDHDFVERWCHGYEGLVMHVRQYTPEYVEQVTGVPADDMIEAARIFAKGSPTALLSGRGIDQLGANTLPTLRSLAILRAITGNVDKPGACVLNTMSDYIPEIDMEMSYSMPAEVRAQQLNTPFSPLQSFDGWDHAIGLTYQHGKRLPMRYLTSAHPNLVWRAMVTGEPYPVRALIVEAANPLVTYANTHLVYEAMQHLDLMVVLEYYMTPTAQMADYVLPSAAAFERPLFQAQGGVANVAYGGGAAVEPYYERQCDYYFFRELGLRMGQTDCWPQETLEEALDVQMSTTGIDWETFKERGIYYGRTYYSKHELEYGEDGQKWGFATSTGKVELRCEYMVELGATEYPEPVPVDDDVDRGFARDMGLATADDGSVVGAAGSTPAMASQACGDDTDGRGDAGKGDAGRGCGCGPAGRRADGGAGLSGAVADGADARGVAAGTGDCTGDGSGGCSGDGVGDGTGDGNGGCSGDGSADGTDTGNGGCSGDGVGDGTDTGNGGCSGASPVKDPRVMRMITGARKQPYWASSYFNNPKFRKTHPYPTAAMSKATLEAADIEPGQWVQVSTSKGSVRFMATEEEMVDGVVSVEYGWWYPEDNACSPGLGGIWKSNVNVLTSGDIETSEKLIGSWKYNGILCKVEPVEETQEPDEIQQG